ncbi:geraniol 8-hydroxylase-like [Aristolochia californica]|uniref:geraniol 8-hydroxylase-like n=1 Tax=Aristolochia californica TaxID=171875 RepID=UPI0035E0E8DD
MESGIVFLCVSLFLITVHAILQAFRRRKLPPGPFGLPIVGNLFLVMDRPHESLAALAKSHGPLMTLQLGFVTTVVASSPEMAKEILQKNGQSFAGRTVPDAVTAGAHYELSSAWVPPNAQWRSRRKIFNAQIFTATRLDALETILNQKMTEMVDYVRELSPTGQAVDIGHLAFSTMLNAISNVVFSVDLVDYKSDGAQQFKDMMVRIMEDAGKPNLSDFFPFLKSFDLQGIRRHIKVAYDYHQLIIDDLIDQRLQSRSLGLSRKNDFLDILLDHSQEQGSEFDRLCVKILISDLFIAGGDTSANTVEWVMAELMRNTWIMAKVQEELRQAVESGRAVERSDISRLGYLQAVVKETMRLHPVTPLLLPHRAETDTEVCGYFIPRNTQVLVNAWAIARDGSQWNDATSFMPERFMESEVDYRGTDFGFIPFGASRRMCPGWPLAVRVVHLMVASLVHSFDWNLPVAVTPEKMDMTDKFGVTLRKAVPLLAVPVER